MPTSAVMCSRWIGAMEGKKPVAASFPADASSPATSVSTDADTFTLELAREVGRLRKELEAMTRQGDI